MALLVLKEVIYQYTYNNTSYQCIFTINDTIIESDTAGTVTVIGMYVSTYILLTYIAIYSHVRIIVHKCQKS